MKVVKALKHAPCLWLTIVMRVPCSTNLPIIKLPFLRLNMSIPVDSIEKNIHFILAHFKGQEYSTHFLRTIMTHKTSVQVMVYSMEEMMKHFEESNYVDCRINGYPFHDKRDKNTKLYPSFIFIDLDLSVFEKYKDPKQKLDQILKQTLKNIKDEIDGHPTVLWTGGGYHIYQPIDLSIHKDSHKFTLESIDEFRDFIPIIRTDLTTDFIRFAAKYLTNGKGDPKHNPSIFSCLIRIPGTINSKYGQEVKIIQKWDSKEADAIPLLRPFWDHLIQMKIELDETRRNTPNKVPIIGSENIKWIENLLQTPIPDHRYFCVWHILIPYLKNIKGLSENEVISIITEWLDKCNKTNKIMWKYPQRIKDQLRYDKGFPPISFENLKSENFELYNRVSN